MLKSNDRKVVYKKKYPRAKVMRNRRIVKVLSYIFGFCGCASILFWSGTNENVSLLSTSWLLLLGIVLVTLAFGGAVLLDATNGSRATKKPERKTLLETRNMPYDWEKDGDL